MIGSVNRRVGPHSAIPLPVGYINLLASLDCPDPPTLTPTSITAGLTRLIMTSKFSLERKLDDC